jgi:glyoxylate reductase
VFDREILDSADKLKTISTYSVGFDHIDINCAKKKRITIGYTPDVLTNATAELTIGLILDLLRRITEGDHIIRKGMWNEIFGPFDYVGTEVSESRLGILGMGRIGRAVADRARSFGMKIHYHNRSRLDKNLEKDAIYHKSLESLLSVSNFFSINCPATKETKYIINNKTIKHFPDGAIISNSSRGDMIDDNAMVEALKNGKIFSLGLDVYNGEPNIHPEYLTLPNVFVLPHLGSATIKTRIAMGDLAISNIDEFFKTGKCKNKVN